MCKISILFLCECVCFVCVCVCVSVCLCLRERERVNSSSCLYQIKFSVCLSICVSLTLSVCVCLSVGLSIRLPVKYQDTFKIVNALHKYASPPFKAAAFGPPIQSRDLSYDGKRTPTVIQLIIMGDNICNVLDL